MIYDRYWRSLLSYATKVISHKEEAEDIVQDIFISLWSRRLQIEDSTCLRAFLFTATRYKTLSLLRNHEISSKYLNSLASFAEQYSDSLNEQFQAAELSRLITTEVNKMPAKMKAVFVLSRQADLSHKAISEKLLISDKTVKKQINNALRHLRVVLAENDLLLLLFFLSLVYSAL